ncbi:MAG: Maf family protein [Shimia sp.]
MILASTSQSRIAMLRAAGVSVTPIPPRVDEDAIKVALEAEGASPRDMADTLAEAKARKVASQGHSGPILGSDQLLVLGSDVFSKPTDREDAADQLSRLSGQTHKLLSAAVIYRDGAPVWRVVQEARLTMRSLTPTFIETYLDHEWPRVASSVGAYHVEGFGARLFARIDGDLFTVMGLPLIDVLGYLVRAGDIDG